MELRLWRLLAVVAAVLLAASHLAATRGMGAIVLIGLCVRHMTAFKSFSKARGAARQAAGAWPTWYVKSAPYAGLGVDSFPHAAPN